MNHTVIVVLAQALVCASWFLAGLIWGRLRMQRDVDRLSVYYHKAMREVAEFTAPGVTQPQSLTDKESGGGIGKLIADIEGGRR